MRLIGMLNTKYSRTDHSITCRLSFTIVIQAHHGAFSFPFLIGFFAQAIAENFSEKSPSMHSDGMIRSYAYFQAIGGGATQSQQPVAKVMKRQRASEEDNGEEEQQHRRAMKTVSVL